MADFDSLPLTFVFAYRLVDKSLWPMVMTEFASCGAEHLVLDSSLIKKIADEPLLINELKKLASDAGLDFVDSHAPMGIGYDLNCPYRELRGTMISRHKMHLNIAAAMGVKTMTIHIGNEHHYHGEFSDQEHFDFICEALDELLVEAEKCGVRIAIENIWMKINTPDKVVEIKRHYPTEFLGLCYDSGHANVLNNGRHTPGGVAERCWFEGGETQILWEDHALEKMLPEIISCHLHDNDAFLDRHAIPGKGNVDWEHEIKLLRQAPKLMSIQCEAFPERSGNTIREIVQSFRQLLNR